jgi:hypothetical protein
MSIAVTTETQEVKLHPLAATTDPVLAEHADEIRRLGKQTVENIIEIGARLTECKHICGHGNWLPWLEREFGWEETTAQRFMRVHALAQSKSGNLPDLPVSAIYLLAAPSTPQAARSEIIERAKTGTPVLVAEVKAIIDTAKGSRRLAKKKAKTGKSKVASECEPAKIAKAAAEAPQVSLDKNPVCLAWKTATEVERAEFAHLFGDDVRRYADDTDHEPSSAETDTDENDAQETGIEPPQRQRRKKLETPAYETTLSAAVSAAFGELAELGSECRQVVDNALSETQRIQTLGETADSLEDLYEPSVPTELSEIKISMPKSRKPRSRGDRRDTAVSTLEACVAALGDIGENDPRFQKAQALQAELEDALSATGMCEFPGMYG